MWGTSDPNCPVDLAKLTASVKAHEGTGPMTGGRFMPYRDSTGHLTIAFGINLDDGLDPAEGEWLLQYRLDGAIQEAQAQPWWPAVRGNDARGRALVEMGYNLGFAGLAGFSRAIACIMQSDWIGAAAEFLDSAWARQVGDRAVVLTDMIRTGQDATSSG